MKLEFSRQIFEEISNIEFHQNPSSGSRVVTLARTDGRTDTHDEVLAAFPNFVKAPKNYMYNETKNGTTKNTVG